MLRHAAFLKGMNLGGRRITNEDLRTSVEALGLGEVQTFRASGNLVFDGGRRSDVSLQRLLERGLHDALGYDVATFIRSRREVLELAAATPFDLSGSSGKLQVALLHEPPTTRARRAALALAGERDRLAFSERELFWLPDGPMSASPLDWTAIERAVGPTTVRTIGTIEQIAARYFA
ncbi:MAG: hypothetical protein JWM60_1632 [Solirubrobacterales bacterium]|nr:hypothetical protein [Solirubrobacterales bacterium]